MMSFLVPSALVVGAVALAAAIAVHFITRSRPRPEPLPTARFIPDRPLRARARTLALDDVVLLAIRMAALAALAAAVAAPVRSVARGRVLRVIALDRSRAVAATPEVRDAARALVRAGDVLIAFDTTAAVVSLPGLDSIAAASERRAPGSLSTALAAAIGMAERVTRQTDSIELVLVSPFVQEEVDEATMRIRRSWPGRLRVVPVRAAAPVPFAAGVESSAPPEDPLIAAVALTGLQGAPSSIRLVRTSATPNDTTWAREPGHVLIQWPAAESQTSWPRRVRVDTVGAVAAGSATLVARLARVWSLDRPDSRTIARWIDGERAAIEYPIGDGCIRDVAIRLDPGSDLTLRPAFRPFLLSLLAPCGGAQSFVPMGRAALDSLAGRGPLVAAAFLRDRHETTSPWSAWLLIAGALLLIIELGVRRLWSAAA